MTNDEQMKTALRVMLKGFTESKGIPEKMYIGLRHFVLNSIGPVAVFELDDLVELTEDRLVVSRVSHDILIPVIFKESVSAKKEENTVLL